MIRLYITVENEAQVQQRMRLFRVAMHELEIPLKQSANYVRMKTNQAFSYGGAEGQWKPLSPKTIERKGSSQILIDTGRMRADATSPANQNLSGDSVRLFVPTEYAHWHQYGGGRTPQRKFFVVRPDEEPQIATYFRRYLQSRLQ